MLKKRKWAMGLITGVMLMTTACGGGANTANTGNEAENTAPASIEDAASGYPEKQITFIAPNGAGSGLDTNTRVAAKVLNTTGLVEQVINVENMPGGGQNVALAEYVTKDKKNDYRLYFSSTPLIINNLRKEANSPYSFRDITPLAQLTVDYIAISVRSDSKYTDLNMLIEDLKKDPQSVTFAGGSAPGSLDHVGAMLPMFKAGIDPKSIKYLAYSGAGEAITSLLGGNADVLTTNVSGTAEYLKAGKVRVLGVSSPERLEGVYKDVPTFKEQGVDAEFANWRGLFGPTNMSPEAKDFWDKALMGLAAHEEWKKELQNNNWDDGYKNSDDFKVFLEKQDQVMRELLKSMDMLKE